MKKLLLTTLLIGVTTLTMAKEIDLTESKGIDQEVIVSFNPTPASLTVDENITFKIIFNVDLDEKHVKKNDIQLQNISDNPRNINGNVAYIADEKAVTFKAEQPLAEGYYEIAFKSLKATKANKDEQIKEIKYQFYVPEVINGHMLPPVPDSKINDATLEGVDVNNNGVRDDVERKILQTYREPVEVEVLLAYAKTHQEMLNDPVSLAIESQKKMSKVSDCRMYLNDQGVQIDSIVEPIENFTYNTKKRVKEYLKFNKALGGGSYGSGPADWTAEACDFDIDE